MTVTYAKTENFLASRMLIPRVCGGYKTGEHAKHTWFNSPEGSKYEKG